MGYYAVCFIECEDCYRSDELFSSFDGAKIGNSIQVNLDKAGDEAEAQGYRFVDGRWLCHDCLEAIRLEQWHDAHERDSEQHEEN